MCYTFASVGAAVAMRVEHCYQNGTKWWFRLQEISGKRHEVPAHHNAADYTYAYLTAAGIAEDKKGPLFRSVDKHRRLTANPMTRIDVLRMIKRGARAAALPQSTGCHTSGPLRSRLTWRTAARSRTRRGSRRTSRRAPPSSTTALRTRRGFRPSRSSSAWRESGSLWPDAPLDTRAIMKQRGSAVTAQRDQNQRHHHYRCRRTLLELRADGPKVYTAEANLLPPPPPENSNSLPLPPPAPPVAQNEPNPRLPAPLPPPCPPVAQTNPFRRLPCPTVARANPIPQPP